MQNKKRIATLAVAGALVGTCGISAYFTATDTVTNNFNVEGVDVELTEPSYEDEKQITPNETVAKDPTVENVDSADQFVFMSIKVPHKEIVTAQLDGTRNALADTELFTWNTATEAGTLNAAAGSGLGKVNAGWTLIETIEHADDVEYIYAWGTADAMTVLQGTKAEDGSTQAGGKTAPLFNSVTMCNAIEGQGLENTEVDIDVAVYAIQTSDLAREFGEAAGTTAPAEVYNIYAAQWNSETSNEAISVIQ